MYTYIKDILKEPQINESMTVGGWVRTVRDNKNFAFIELNDGTHFKSLQIVVNNGLPNYASVAKLSPGSAITVTGVLVDSLGQKQAVELQAQNIVINGAATADYPLQKKRHTLEYLRTIAHLRPRSNTFSAVFRVRSLAALAVHDFFNERGFTYLHAPIITGSDAEGAGEMFHVTSLDIGKPPRDQSGNVDYRRDFFGKPTNLTVSGQLSAEAFALALRNVYTFGPTFRAENSNTTRHAAEFWMIEPEMAFADLENDMELAESMLKYIIRHLLEKAPDEMAFFNSFIDKGLMNKLNNIINSPFGHVTYTQAIRELERADKKFNYPISWGMDLQTEHERFLTEHIYKRPIFVTDYPKDIKAFYMRVNDDEKTVAAMDLLAPGIGEIIGGSQREERLDVLERRMDELRLNKEDYAWYLDLRKFGTVKHAGFGMGFERVIMYVTGMQNIRDVIPFARTVNNAEF
ncbi:MAG: asparagine--tRNA ligase [Clostridiales bacterium]|jgi:asparaginyl-tRNA synthetase|nr:asparagine--tRNA ligase [Clostridiales bacterium]